jgi:plastocyanin
MNTLSGFSLSKALKKHVMIYAVLVIALIALLPPTKVFALKKSSGSSVRTYTVMVGLERPNKGIGINAYFPESVTIHVGDTVRWIQNSNEIHTVTFPDGILPPPLLQPSDQVTGADPSVSPLVFSPFAVQQNPLSGSEFGGGIGAHANSGIMGREPGQVEEYELIFTTEGTFGYICLVHGSVMSGEVVVVGADEDIASPNQVRAQGRKEMSRSLAQVPSVVRAAKRQIEPAEVDPDGTRTHHVLIGYADGQIDLMQFFPNKLTVRPGDTVIWEMSSYNDAPHTVTFLNGAEEPPLAVPSNGFLYLNPEVVFPQGTDELTRTGVYSSGLLVPDTPEPTYSLVIGEMNPRLLRYICLLHDSSGMKGRLMVVRRKANFDED